MLRIFVGRENIDKEKAMFERMDSSVRSYIIVPDQYTLQMERNAIEYFNPEGLMDIEVLSFSRLTGRVLNETGTSKNKVIDKNGRHMLLSKIIQEEQKNLKAFGGMTASHTFIDLMNNLISEIKQHNSTPLDIEQALDYTNEASLLKRKLEDIHLIFEKYEAAISDKFIDTESYLDFFISKISESKLIKEGSFWISGFDSLTPKAMEIIKEIAFNGETTNIILSHDKTSKLFQLTEDTINKLEKTLGKENIKIMELSSPLARRSEVVSHLEKNLFEFPFQVWEEESPRLQFLNAANFYNEAESAASFIIDIIKEKDLRYRDIAVICNDMDERAAIIKRVFDEYGISYFIDKKHSVYHNPVVVFILSLLDGVISNWSYEDVFSLAKTGFIPLEEEALEDLENYSIKYKIRGRRWKEDFEYGLEEYGDEGLAQLNEYRSQLWSYLGEYEEANSQAKTVKERVLVLREFLEEKINIEEKLELLCQALEEDNYLEEALELQQIWEKTFNLFEQLIELVGNEKMNLESFSKVLRAGFDSLELGLIPTTVDQVVVGTMQRTRTGNIKALFILGANDGILPAESRGEEVLSLDEKKFLLDKDILFCRDDEHKIMEENLAIYKQISRAEEVLWISYSMADLEGREIRPSMIFNKMRKIFPNQPVVKDIVNREENMALISRPKSSLKYLTEALKNHRRNGMMLDEEWQSAYNWFYEQDKKSIDLMERGLAFDNKLEKLSEGAVRKLFRIKDDKKIKLSPTRLERYSRCPFAHLVRYGLRPDEKRIFKVSGREVGDVYHHCLMVFTKELTLEGVPLNHENSPWMKISDEEIGERISFHMKEIAKTYKEGLLGSGKEEEYRLERMILVCEKAALALVEHVRQGRIDKIFFEEGFSGRGDSIMPAISIRIGGQEYQIEGKIDRIDILPGNYAKIIDYKSGRERFNPKEALGGWRLQLMLYLKAVREGMENVKPGGVFYFEISDLMVDSERITEKKLADTIKNEMMKKFRLDGAVLDNEEVITSIAGEFSGYSDILPIRKNKSGVYSGNAEGRLLGEDEFLELEEAMDTLIKGLCQSLFSGTIDIKPKKLKDISACTYCDYKSICGFDLSFQACSYDIIDA